MMNEKRIAGMELAENNANKKRPGFSESFENFILETGKDLRGGFTGEDVKTLYQAREDLPQPPKDFRSTGAIYSRLKRDGKIHECGSVKVSTGCLMPVYKLGRKPDRVPGLFVDVSILDRAFEIARIVLKDGAIIRQDKTGWIAQIKDARGNMLYLMNDAGKLPREFPDPNAAILAVIEHREAQKKK